MWGRTSRRQIRSARLAARRTRVASRRRKPALDFHPHGSARRFEGAGNLYKWRSRSLSWNSLSPTISSFPPLSATSNCKMSNIIDLEKHGDQTSSRTPSVDKDYGVSSATPAVPGEVGEVVVIHRGKYLQKCVDFMNRMGGEERGIERVLPYEKTDQKPFDNFSVWYLS